MVKKGKKKENKYMNEEILISRTYISKEDFFSDIKIDCLKLEVGGDDDQIWFIDNKSSKTLAIVDIVFKKGNNFKYSKEQNLIIQSINKPYENGVFYFFEYRDSKIMKEIEKSLNIDGRDIYILLDNDDEFKKVY